MIRILRSKTETTQEMIVALEGGVCAGKSTVATLLETLGVGRHVQEYATRIPYSAQRSIFELDPVARAASFLSIDSGRIHEMPQTELKILDRSCLTVFAFEYACVQLGINELELPLLDLVESYAVMVPNCVIFLDITDDVREKRLAVRGKRFIPILANRNFNKHFKGFFEAMNEYLGVFFVQTSVRPALEVAEICKKILTGPVPSSAPLQNIRKVLGHVFDE